MFTLRQFGASAIERALADAATLGTSTPSLLSIAARPGQDIRLPAGFVHDFRRTQIGQGQQAFAAARRAFARWEMFDLGWVRVANPQAVIAPGQLVAVAAHTLGLWTLNLSRITEVVDEAADTNPAGMARFGFLYATTASHVEMGEERFLLEYSRENGEVFYELEAVSRPRSPLARMGLPFTRHFQHRFARQSHLRMLQEVLAIDAEVG